MIYKIKLCKFYMTISKKVNNVLIMIKGLKYGQNLYIIYIENNHKNLNNLKNYFNNLICVFLEMLKEINFREQINNL